MHRLRYASAGDGQVLVVREALPEFLSSPADHAQITGLDEVLPAQDVQIALGIDRPAGVEHLSFDLLSEIGCHGFCEKPEGIVKVFRLHRILRRPDDLPGAVIDNGKGNLLAAREQKTLHGVVGPNFFPIADIAAAKVTHRTEWRDHDKCLEPGETVRDVLDECLGKLRIRMLIDVAGARKRQLAEPVVWELPDAPQPV